MQPEMGSRQTASNASFLSYVSSVLQRPILRSQAGYFLSSLQGSRLIGALSHQIRESWRMEYYASSLR
jgi:hypothetical protein